MASLMIHMVIGQEYCRKNVINNIDEFLKGNLSPDLFYDKEKAHGVDITSKSNNYDEAIKNRVNLANCCKDLDIAKDFDKGVFLHLLTDYYFYNLYMLNLASYKSIKDKTYKVMNKLVYDEYARVANVLMENFEGVRLDLLPDFACAVDKENMKLFSKDSILSVVDKCSSFDLDKIFKNIKNNNCNFL